jgi:protoporphyrinogen/coproporphyrinogen III oxidase
MNTHSSKPHVAIVGGGIAGLSAAWVLRGCTYTVLEQSERWGGKVLTEREGGYIIEGGPDGFLTRKPWALQLAHELGLSHRVISVNALPERIYVLSKGKLHPLPDGLQLLVPSKILPFLRSGLFSWHGKLRVLLEPFIKAKRSDEDESLAQFVTRRLGAEALDKLGEPLLAGVYNADSSRQSIMATFPNFRQLEKQYGSLLKGIRAAQREPSGQPALVSFKNGVGEIIDALVEKLDGDLRLGVGVEAITQDERGYRLTLTNGESLYADAVILATPAPQTAALLADLAPESSRILSEIRYSGIGSVTLAFKRADVPHPLDAFGMVIPSSEGRQIEGMQWSSSKWANRAEDEIALIRVFFGGKHTRHTLDYDDDKLLMLVQGELRDLLAITAAPLYHRILRWQAGYPQYEVGHRERVREALSLLPSNIAVTGNAYGGVGMPDTIRHAKETAEKVSAALKEMVKSNE